MLIQTARFAVTGQAGCRTGGARWLTGAAAGAASAQLSWRFSSSLR